MKGLHGQPRLENATQSEIDVLHPGHLRIDHRYGMLLTCSPSYDQPMYGSLPMRSLMNGLLKKKKEQLFQQYSIASSDEAWR